MTPLEELDVITAAWQAGYDQGLAVGRQQASEDLARSLLHEQAAVMAGLAVHTARANHGPAWADAMAEAAEGSAA